MDAMQRYLVEEEVEHYQHGEITHTELTRRVTLILGSSALALSVLTALGCGTPRAAAPLATAATQPGATISPNDPEIEAQMVTFLGEGTEVMAYRVRPRAAGVYPAVIVIHENRGLNEHIMDVTRRFGKERFVGLGVDLLSREGGTAKIANPNDVPGALSRIGTDPQVQDLLAAVRYLKTLDFVRQTGFGVTGFCYGGGMAWRLATKSPDIKAAVPFYGANPPLEDVPNIAGPVLAHYGGEDARINAGLPAIEQAMKAANKPFEYYIYEGAPHAFHNDTGASYRPEAARLAWQRTIEFFNKYLRG
jgi:carboxymethylenebutenolidase